MVRCLKSTMSCNVLIIPALLSWFVVVTGLRVNNSTVVKLKQSYSSASPGVTETYSSFHTASVQQNKSGFEKNADDGGKKHLSKTSLPAFVTGTTSDIFSTGRPALSTEHEIKQGNNLSSSSDDDDDDDDDDDPQEETNSVTRSTAPDSYTFREYVLLESDSMDKCFKGREKLQHHVLHMEIFMDHATVQGDFLSQPANQKAKLECSVEIVVPEDRVVKVEVVYMRSTCDNVNRLHVAESRSLNSIVDECDIKFILGEFSLSHRVTVSVVVNKYNDFLVHSRKHFVLHLKLTAVTRANQLEVDLLRGLSVS